MYMGSKTFYGVFSDTRTLVYASLQKAYLASNRKQKFQFGR